MREMEGKMVVGKGAVGALLSESEVRELIAGGFSQESVAGKRVLAIVPDGTRTAPVPQFFRLFYEELWGRVAALDYLVALGTHLAMTEESLCRLVGVTPEARATRYGGARIFNHAWDDPAALTTLGTIGRDEIGHLSGGLLRQDVRVAINRLVLDYDLLVICGPTFPHEVVGFSGGNKYFFPGISGADMINFTHWLSAIITNYKTIGTRDTPVRAVIDRAAAMIPRPKLCFSMVVVETGAGPGLAGLYAGRPEEAFTAAADLSSQVHIRWLDRPVRTVLSVMPRQYDDIWTAAKGMYKMEPVVADGGEVVIYAPHITEISYTHGRLLDEIGYHCRDYFLKQWDRFGHIPGGVLAHSTHLNGLGAYDAVTGQETHRVRVTLATGISRERCERLNLGYRDPATINPAEWAGREDEGVLMVPKAGEMLYRLREQPAPTTPLSPPAPAAPWGPG